MFPINDRTISRWKSLPRGQAANEITAHLLSSRLLGYWTFAEPKDRGVEIGDVLVWWDDTVILFEVKTRDSAAGDDSRWVKRRLTDAISQIEARAAMLREGRVVSLRNTWRGQLPWTADKVSTYLGVIVLHHDSDPYDPCDIMGSALSEASLPIQVLSLWDLANLLRFANTVYDLIVYLECRYIARDARPLLIHREADTYREVLGRWPDFANAATPPDAAQKAQLSLVSLFHAAIRHPVATDQDYRDLAQSYLIDYGLGSLVRRADADESGRRVGSPTHDLFVQALGALAELSRIRRVLYGGLWRSAADLSVLTGSIESSSSWSPKRRRSYVFAASPTSAPDPRILAALATATMETHETTSAVAMGGAAECIRSTHDLFLSWCRGETEAAPDASHDLDTQFAYVEVKPRIE